MTHFLENIIAETNRVDIYLFSHKISNYWTKDPRSGRYGLKFLSYTCQKKISSIDKNIGNFRITPFAKLFFAIILCNRLWLTVYYFYIHLSLFLSLSCQNYNSAILNFFPNIFSICIIIDCVDSGKRYIWYDNPHGLLYVYNRYIIREMLKKSCTRIFVTWFIFPGIFFLVGMAGLKQCAK